LDQEQRLCGRALFDRAIDSRLRGCEMIKIKIGDLLIGNQIVPERCSFSKRPVGFNSSFWNQLGQASLLG
jgi:hypothetical protein